MNRKILYSSCVCLGLLGATLSAEAQYHASFLGVELLPAQAGITGPGADLAGAAGRALGAAVKYFLADDQDLLAELAFKDGSSCGGGCGGCYGGAGTASIALDAKIIPVTIDESIYDEGTSLGQANVIDLTKQRIRGINSEQASLDELDRAEQIAYYYMQQRAIQAMANALVMKNAYTDLAKVAGQLGSNFENYAGAAGEIASRRILLDELLALKKRVIAARVRTRAQTLEMTIDSDKAGVPEI